MRSNEVVKSHVCDVVHFLSWLRTLEKDREIFCLLLKEVVLKHTA